jgi:hypothetical protein
MNGGGSLPMLTFDVGKLAGGSDAERDKRLRELLEETAPAAQKGGKTSSDQSAAPAPPPANSAQPQ